MITLTYEEAVTLLERAVEEKGEDYRYPYAVNAGGFGGCMYFNPTGTPSCGVGFVFSYKGVTAKQAEFWNVENVESLEMAGDLVCDGATLTLLRRFQEEQDNGAYWGDALYTAKYESRLLHA